MRPATSTLAAPVANFFWDGPSLTLWSRACIRSFERQGFDVSVYSYSKTLGETLADDGIRVLNAAAICEPGFREGLLAAAAPDSYGKTYACFSDFFRLRLMAQRPGTWWLDTDVFCLQPAARFAELQQRHAEMTICGFQHPSDAPVVKVCNAVLWFGDGAFAGEVNDRLMADYPPFEPHSWGWATTAIPYINDVINQHPERFAIQPRRTFYPLSWQPDELAMLLFEEHLEEARERCSDALTLHFWNEIFTRRNIPRNLLPPDGSFLQALIRENMSVPSSTGTLEAETIKQLLTS